MDIIKIMAVPLFSFGVTVPKSLLIQLNAHFDIHIHEKTVENGDIQNLFLGGLLTCPNNNYYYYSTTHNPQRLDGDNGKVR